MGNVFVHPSYGRLKVHGRVSREGAWRFECEVIKAGSITCKGERVWLDVTQYRSLQAVSGTPEPGQGQRTAVKAKRTPREALPAPTGDLKGAAESVLADKADQDARIAAVVGTIATGDIDS